MPFNSKNSISIAIVSCTAVLAIACIWLFFSRPKIAYVRSLELVYSYNGMKEAHEEYKSRSNEWQANIDTLRQQYDNAVLQYRKDSSGLSTVERNTAEKNMTRLLNNLTGYAAAVQKEAAEQDKKLTSSIIAQINSFIQDYAKKKGYDLVLGAEGTGTIYYGSKAMDITEDVLTAMNKDYKLVGEKKAVQ